MECGLRPDALAGLLRCSQFQQDTGTLVGLAVGSTTQILASLQPARARELGSLGASRGHAASAWKGSLFPGGCVSLRPPPQPHFPTSWGQAC